MTYHSFQVSCSLLQSTNFFLISAVILCPTAPLSRPGCFFCSAPLCPHHNSSWNNSSLCYLFSFSSNHKVRILRRCSGIPSITFKC
jgi:hypothetical protein